MNIQTGKDLREFRKEFDLSESELAKLLKCTKKQIATCEYKHPSRNLPKWLKQKIEHHEGIQALLGTVKPEKQTLWKRILKLFGM